MKEEECCKGLEVEESSICSRIGAEAGVARTWSLR